MGARQLEASDYIRQSPGIVGGRDFEGPRGRGRSQPAEEMPPALRDEEFVGDKGRALGELEELARMLEELHSTMDTALDTVASAQPNALSRTEPAETPAPPPQDDEAASAPETGLAPEAAPASRRRTRVILAGAGAGVCVVVLLGLMSWFWMENPTPEQAAAPLVPATENMAAKPLPQPPAQEAGPGEVSKTNAGTPADSGISAAPARADQEAAPDGAGTPPQLPLTGEPAHGVAGEPIPLGVRLPEIAIARKLSVAVEGVPTEARLTAGMRVGSGIWMVDARQAAAMSLLTPATFPGGQFGLDLRLVSNDGKITQARTLTVSVEPSQAFAAPAEQSGSNAEPSARQESPPMDGATQPMNALQGEAPQALAATETADAASAPDTPALRREDEAEQANLSADAPVQRSAAAEPGEAQTRASANDAETPAEPTRMEPVSTHVNMRAKPFNDAAVITVVPAGAKVGVIECRLWCEVIYADKRGWIYKSFVGARRSSTRTSATSSAHSSAASSESGSTASFGRSSASSSSGGLWKKISPF